MGLIRNKQTHINIRAGLTLSVLSLLLALFTTQLTFAATTITVNSTADVTADDGVCTFREAIIASNDDVASGASGGECPAGSGIDTIEFALTGTADFTNSSQDGYTISLASELPSITETVTINGYSQAGSSQNTTVAPAPFDAVLLVEIDGSATQLPSYTETGIHFGSGSDSSAIRGLIVNGFTTGNAIVFEESEGHEVQGNYIGTNYAGDTAVPNMIGLNSSASASPRGTNVQVGGLDPEDRNIISGNSSGDIPSGSYPGTGWVFEGNYIGVGADGETAVPNSMTGGSGGLSIDDSVDVVVGGPDAAAINIISGNNNQGLAPLNSDDMIIQGNFIGTDYTGTQAVPNGSIGINLNESDNVQILDNVISGNINNDGIYFDNNFDVQIQGNFIGTDEGATLSLPNNSGISAGENNSDVLIGGTSPGDGNIIANNTINGVYLSTSTTLDHSIVGNSIHSNGSLGIDLAPGGVTKNDEGDGDSGPNDLLNFPSYKDVTEAGGDTSVDYVLDVPAGDYRIEFFSNTTADASGNGEGETFLGFDNITHPGGGEEAFTHVLSGVTGVTNLALTATEIDASADGFGATSEFGADEPKVSDFRTSFDLLNPDDVELGATLTYRYTITNDGPDTVDLTQFAGFTPSLTFKYFAPDLTALNQGPDGPVPGSKVITDNGGNADITCLWSPQGSAGTLAGQVDYADYSVSVCVYSGGSGTLAADESIVIDLDFVVENDSDLVFTNYALSAGDLVADPDSTEIISIGGQANNLPLYIAAAQDGTPLNNFSISQYPVPVEVDGDSGGGGIDGAGDGLVSAGVGALISVVGAIIALTVALLTLRSAPLRLSE